jgi:hypothetical protein
MNAWLITWEYTRNLQDSIVAILSSRKSDTSITELVEFIYLKATSSAEDLVYYTNRLNRIPYKAEKTQMINDVPHGDRIICGHNPFLYARKVTDLKVAVNHEQGLETISWKEPPIFKWRNKRLLKTVIDRDGEQESITRDFTVPIGKDITGNR